MGKRKLTFSVRTRHDSPFWQYRTAEMHYYKPTDVKIKWKSGKPTNRKEAENWAAERWEAFRGQIKGTGTTLASFLNNYFIPGKCPHISRIRADRGRFSDGWAAQLRSSLDRYVLTDPIAGKDIAKLRPGDFEDFKGRLTGCNVSTDDTVKHLSARSVNVIMGALKTAIREGYYRGDIDHNPTEGVGKVAENSEEAGIFTLEEIREILSAPDLFEPPQNTGAPRARLAYAFFVVCALTGERPGAILTLKWDNISGDEITFEKTKTHPDGRRIPVVRAVADALEAVRGKREYIFGYDDGTRCTKTWYLKRFYVMIKRAGLPELDEDGRKRIPYSFKHSLITHLIDAGVDEVLVREYVGHSHGSGRGRLLTRTQQKYKHAQTSRLRLILPEIEGLFADKM